MSTAAFAILELTTLLLLSEVHLGVCRTQYGISVGIVSYSNPGHLCRFCDGGSTTSTCCDPRNNATGLCGQCDNVFVFCLRPIGTTGFGQCSPPTITSQVNLDSETIDFDSNTFLGLQNPLLLPGRSRNWNSAQLTVTVRDDDDGEQGNLVDNFLFDILRSSTPPNQVMALSLNGSQGIATIQLTYEIQCTPGFIGRRCRTVDVCYCSGNGRCSDGVCQCDVGFTGGDCSVLDHCASTLCENGQCVNGGTSATCTCFAGYTGAACKVTFCSLEDCGNGVCVFRDGSTECDCDSGYTGAACRVTLCSLEDCGNGECVFHDGSTECDCNSGYTGAACKVTLCSLEDCGNGVCVFRDGSTACDCDSGYTGVRCNRTDYCHMTDCGEGECVNEVNSFSCDCSPQYTGELCDVKDNCEVRSCEKGECVNEVVLGSFSCSCNAGYAGEFCDVEDHCFGVESCGDGECVNQEDTFSCMCSPGFTGESCQVDVDDCMNVSCSGRGQCVDGVDSSLCICDDGYTGTACEEFVTELASKGRVIPLTFVGVGAAGAVLVLLLVVLAIVAVVMVCVRRHKEPTTDSLNGEIAKSIAPTTPAPITPGDNPVYMLTEAASNSNIYDTIGKPDDEERVYYNPLYGDQRQNAQDYEVPMSSPRDGTFAQTAAGSPFNAYDEPSPRVTAAFLPPLDYEVPNASTHRLL